MDKGAYRNMEVLFKMEEPLQYVSSYHKWDVIIPQCKYFTDHSSGSLNFPRKKLLMPAKILRRKERPASHCYNAPNDWSLKMKAKSMYKRKRVCVWGHWPNNMDMNKQKVFLAAYPLLLLWTPVLIVLSFRLASHVCVQGSSCQKVYTVSVFWMLGGRRSGILQPEVVKYKFRPTLTILHYQYAVKTRAAILFSSDTFAFRVLSHGGHLGLSKAPSQRL